MKALANGISNSEYENDEEVNNFTDLISVSICKIFSIKMTQT